MEEEKLSKKMPFATDKDSIAIKIGINRQIKKDVIVSTN
jgi:hypothetical protein